MGGLSLHAKVCDLEFLLLTEQYFKLSFVVCVVLETEMFTSAGNNISKTAVLQGKHTNTGTELDQLKETHDSYKRTTFKDIGGESGVTVGFKTKSLKQ